MSTSFAAVLLLGWVAVSANAVQPRTIEKSVEALAQSTRQSVVVISHFGRDGKEDGIGAGFIVSSNGLVATSLHVIGEARPITLQLADGQRYEATEIYAWDRKLDLAVVRINAGKTPALPLGDSDALKQGTPVVAMGNPLGLERSIVQGVVSATRDFDGVEMIQLAIPIEPGNSGGPLLDMQGRVQGLLTLKSAVTANLGFAMPVNALKALLRKPNPVPMDRWLAIASLDLKQWTPLFGARWSQKAGRIQVEGQGDGFGGRSLCLAKKSVPKLPYEIAVTVRLEDEAGAAGLAFAADGDQKHYGFYPSGGQLRLTRFDGPTVFTWTILQQTGSVHYHPGQWNTLKVRVEKEKIRCFVNDQLVIESDDHALAGGQVGLAKFRDTKASFRNFRIGTNLPSASPAPAQEMAALTKEIQQLGASPDAETIASLQSHAGLSRSILAERAGQLEQQAASLRKLASHIHYQAVQEELVALFRAPEEQVDLFHAALLVSKLDNPDLDVEAYRTSLSEMARELSARLSAKSADAVKLAALTKYLFTDNGFHGSRTDYYNRANSYINEVLDEREGLPITLSVLFLELARRIGLQTVAGVSLPGHFVVKYIPARGQEQLIDVFDGGKPLTRAAANELVLNFTSAPLKDEQLKSAGKRDIIIRMLQNLLRAAQQRESTADSLRYLDVIVALAPDAPLERYSRALLRLRSGDSPGAKADFKWLLDNQPAEIDLERLMELYHSL
jgi:S1-C subfamily serine protease/regulator of sirC expression with transglutaminase-like and TPR domain